MSERKPEKKVEAWSIEDRFKLAKALIKNKSLEHCATFILAKYDKDIAKYKSDCRCQCDCKKCERIGITFTLKLIGLFV